MWHRVTQLFSSPDPVEISADTAPAFFAERYSDRLDTLHDRKAEHIDAIDAAINNLQESVAQLEDYTDSDGRTMIEDVVQHFHRERIQTLDTFKLPEEPDAVHGEVASLTDEFRTMKQKTSMVLEKRVRQADTVFNQLQQVEDQNQQLKSFVEDDWQTVERYQTVTSIVDQIDALETEITELESRVENIDIESINREITAKQDELDAHMAKDAWDDRETVETRHADLQAERDQITSDIDAARSRVERGLKKLVYAAEHDDIQLESGTVDTLRSLRDGDIGDTHTVIDAVDEAVTAIVDEELLGDRKRSTFVDAAATLQNLDEQRNRIGALDAEIEQCEDKLTVFTVTEEKQAIEAEIERLQDERQSSAERRKQLRSRIQEKQDEITDHCHKLEELLNQEFAADVTVTY